MLRISDENGAAILEVKVVPGASRTRFLGEWDQRAKFAIAAPPERGKANRALIAFLAKHLGIAARRVSVVRGETSATKTIRLEGVSAAEVAAALPTDQR